ncbi:MAG: pilus assembly PilX N-terminal domain-containing protein [Synergistaceae bacterium]
MNNENKSGLTLFTVMIMLAFLSIVGVYAYNAMRTDIYISNNYREGVEAFCQADAGIFYVRGLIEQQLKEDTLIFVDGDNSVFYEPPEGFTFLPITNIHKISEGIYCYECTGKKNNSSATVKVVVARKPLLMAGLLGDLRLNIQPLVNIYSYDSISTFNPIPSDSSSEATIGSNFLIEISPGVFIDGEIEIGQSPDGIPAVIVGDLAAPIVDFGRFEEDPLGAIGGEIESQFIEYMQPVNNNNLLVDPPQAVVGTELFMKKNTATQFVTLEAGNYYLTDIQIGPDCVLTIDDSNGPVNIYLDGEMYAGPGSDINSPSPLSFSIFSRAEDPILVQPNGSFDGFIYAPFSEVTMKPGNDGHGVVWGDKVYLYPQGDWYIDINLLKRFLSKELYFMSWKEIRN